VRATEPYFLEFRRYGTSVVTIMIDAVTLRIEQEGTNLESKHFKCLELHVTFKR
jgi:hypothetical protein